MIYYTVALTIAGIIVGWFFGHVITKANIRHKHTRGTLKTAYDPDDDQTYLFLELNPDSPPDRLRHDAWVIFDVDTKVTRPQK